MKLNLFLNIFLLEFFVYLGLKKFFELFFYKIRYVLAEFTMSIRYSEQIICFFILRNFDFFVKKSFIFILIFLDWRLTRLLLYRIIYFNIFYIQRRRLLKKIFSKGEHKKILCILIIFFFLFFTLLFSKHKRITSWMIFICDNWNITLDIIIFCNNIRKIIHIITCIIIYTIRNISFSNLYIRCRRSRL